MGSSEFKMKPGTLVHARYRDHVLFRNRQSQRIQPAIRECVGWVCKENAEAVLIVWDRCVPPFGGNKVQPESGLCLLKSDILEIENILFQHHLIPSNGDHLLSGSAHNQNMSNMRPHTQMRRKIRPKQQKEIGKT